DVLLKTAAMNRIPRFSLVFALLLGPVVCGCGKSSKPLPDATGRDKLTEIAQMLTTVQEIKSAPPANLADLERVEPFMPVAGADLRSGEIVYCWGAGLD